MYVNRKGIGIGQLFSLERALNIHEKGFTIPKTISDCKNRSAKRTCVGLDLLSFHSVRVLVLNISIRELTYYQ